MFKLDGNSGSGSRPRREMTSPGAWILNVPPSDRRRAGIAVRRLVVAGGGITSVGIVAYLLYDVLHGPIAITAKLMILGLAGALLTLAVYLVTSRITLLRLQRGIRRAQEGRLEPVSDQIMAGGFLRRLVSDYNVLVTNLGSTLSEIEECQNRIIGERNRNEAILHSLSGALLCVDGDLRINLSNERAQELSGLTQGELHGRNLFEVLTLDEAGRELLRDAFLYEWPVSNKEITVRVAGAERFYSLNLSFFESKNLKDNGAVLILQDIMDYKRLQEQIYATEKLAAMGQLAAGVAHELNTPLGNIVGYARLIEQGITDPEQVRQYTAIISHEAKRCARIIKDLLHYARRERCEPETCDLNAAIREVVDTIVNCQGKRFDIEMTLDLAPASILVPCGAGQLDIVLVNLIMNAIQAAREIGVRPRVHIVSRIEENGQATVAVEDNGPGIPQGLRRRIFDPFFTTKEVGKGTGLGLAISQAVVSRIGGTLDCDASFCGGARFILSFPLIVSREQRVEHGS